MEDATDENNSSLPLNVSCENTITDCGDNLISLQFFFFVVKQKDNSRVLMFFQHTEPCTISQTDGSITNSFGVFLLLCF